MQIAQPLSLRQAAAAAARLLGACLALGVAAWLAPASVYVVSWPRAGAGRVALFAPAFRLPWCLGAAVVLAGLVWKAGDSDGAARSRRVWVALPWAALWLWAVPFLPWVPDRWPLLLVLAGPARWAIAGGALVASLARFLSARSWKTPPWRAPGRGVVFVVSLALYLALGFRQLGTTGVGGDEPHYLVITQSLLVDHDLDIENNHARGDYRAFFGGELRPDYMTRGRDGKIYSIHAPGLPVLMLPGYALWGARGAMATVCLLGALAALAVFELGAMVGGAGAAWATWASVSLTVPVVPHAWAIFPEIAGAAVVAWAMVWFARDRPASPAAWACRGVCLATLPWLHTKFVVFLAALTVTLLWRVRRQAVKAAALLAPVVLSGLAWLAFFKILYGTFDPQAPYGDHAVQFVRLVNLPRSLAGALFDQKFGLLPYAPVCLVALAGGWILARDPRWRPLVWAGLAIGAAYVASSARYYMWWGGSSAPARFLVPMMPLAAPMFAAAYARLRSPLARAHAWLLLGASLGVSALAVWDPSELLLFSNPHGVARLAEWAQAGSPLTAALPTFTEENWRAPLTRLGLWACAALVTALLVRGTRRRSAPASTYWTILAEGAVGLVLVSALVGPYAADARAETVRRGRQALMDRFDPGALRALDYRGNRLRKMTSDEWIGASALVIDRDPAEPVDPQGRLTDALALPPGEYRLSVGFRGAAPPGADVLMALGGGHVLARRAAPLGNPATLGFVVPVAVPRLWVQLTDPSAAAQVNRLEIAPVAIVAASARVAVHVRAVEAVSGRPNAYMAYVDDGTYAEGGVFWTRGTGEGEVLIAPAGASRVRLTLHVGPSGGPVRLTIDGDAREVAMAPNETRVVPVDVPTGASVMRLRVRASGSFVPADADPRSGDRRSLGCQVRVEVESDGP